jgi:predicted ATP-grasp superfamily ATP-dependent carboligase
MRDAALEDCRAIPGAEVKTLDCTNNEESDFRRLADWADYALIIAPEFDQILETRCRWAEQCETTLLGPPADVVALCADKLTLAEIWNEAKVPTPPTKPFEPWAFPPPVVVKPRYGAGSVDTYLFKEEDSLHRFQPQTESIVQPYLPGLDMSMAFLIGAGKSIPLICCAQHISRYERPLSYTGGSTFNHQVFFDHVHTISSAAIGIVAGLDGYVGVDVIIRSSIGDLAMEINPRLTTSYVGLRHLCQQNLMEILIRVVQGEQVDPPTWHPGNKRFDCSGNVSNLSEPEA